MARIVVGPRAAKTLRGCDADLARSVEETLVRFVENYRHPSLHFEKLSGFRDLYTIRISRRARIFLRRQVDQDGDVYEVLDFGPHDLYRRL